MTKPVQDLHARRAPLSRATLCYEIEPNVLSRWNLFTIGAPHLWGQYRNDMDWLLFALVSAFAIATIFRLFCCFRSPMIEKHPQRDSRL
jgi:hypothetical protein